MKRLFVVLAFALSMMSASAQGYENPVIKGFNPDPSVCRVGDDYYLVTSSFHYFPGVPLYHSKDLVNWEHIGHVLSRKSQLELPNANGGSGIYAPTIRHHDGKFYMITTNCSNGGNFIVSTDDPYGEWSDPVWIKLPGIDPDLFWDEDGSCWYSGSANNGIVQCRVNPETGEMLSEPKMIWHGTGGRYPEAPHIYKKDGWYYLLISEGGTEFGHGVTIARSPYVDGPYTPAPHNPILTHFKQVTQSNPIQGTGHADIIEAHDGSWWLVCLGFRTQGGQHHLMGRETFLAPVRWDRNAWPVINGSGDFSIRMDVPTLPQVPVSERPAREEFNGIEGDYVNPVVKGLGPEWSWLRNPDPSKYELTGGILRMHGTSADLEGTAASPTFAGVRQKDIDFSAETCLRLRNASGGDKAGMSIFMDSGAHYDVYLAKAGGRWKVCIRYSMGVLQHVEEFDAKGDKVWLKVSGESDYYRLYYSTDGKEFRQVGMNNTRYLSSETVSGFTGVMIGLWAQSPSGRGYADFEYFQYAKE